MKLTTYLEMQNISMAEFGRRIGKSRASVMHYCNLTRIPPIPILIKIRELTSGHVSEFEDWLKGDSGCQMQ